MSEGVESASASFWRDSDDDTALERYQTLVNTIDDGIYQLDPEGNFVAVNDVIVEMTGYSREELLGAHVSLVLEDADIIRIEREIRERLSNADGEVATFEIIVESVTGEPVPVELRISLLVDGGEFRGTIGVARDISTRREYKERTEAALGSYETIASVINEADVGVFIFDEESDVAWIDETAERYFGIDRDTVIGRTRRNLIEETLRGRVAEGDAFTAALTGDESGSAGPVEYRVTAGDGREERWLEHRSKPIESGEYAGGRVELCYDITGQRRRARQLEQLNQAVREWLTETSREAVADRATHHVRDILNMEINGIFLHDPATRELHPTSWTDAAETLFGELPTFTAREGIAWRVFESQQPEVYGDVTEASDVYDPDTPVRSEIVLPIGEHGVVIVGSEQRDAFDDGDLTLAKIVASSLETTFDRIRHERRLERERDLTDQILDATPVGALVLNADGELTRINNRAVELLAVDDPKTFALTDRVRYDEAGDRLPVDEYPYAQALASGEPVYDRVLQVERPDGDRRWLSINAVPITDENGAIDRVVTAAEDVTALKERERELSSELSEILGRVSDAFYALDEQFRFTHVNDRAEELLRRPENELLGERLWDVLPETAEVDDVRKSIHAAMETQEATSYELYFESLEFWAEANIYPSETGVSVYFRDVTDRKERKRELELFRNLVDHSNDSVIVIEPETGRFIDVNDTACDRLGRDRAELLELTVPDIEENLPDQDAWRRHVENVRSDGAVTFEGRHRRADGSTFPVEVNVAHVDLDREYMLAIVRDISDRRQRKRQLEESERRYRTLAEHFPNGFVTLFDDDLEYELAAGRGFAELPVEPDETEGSHFSEVWDEDTADVLEPVFETALDGEERSVELEYAGRDWIVHAAPITDERGDVFAGMTMVQDITERKRHERQLAASNERLEQFAYAASHDLQEPLRMVSTYLSLIEERYGDKLDEDGREFLEFAVDGAERMRNMIDALLEYSRVETHGDPFEPVELDAVLGDALEDLRVRIDESDATVTTEPLPTVYGDSNQLRQVFQNLLDNAIEYCGEKPPRVHVSAERRESRGGTASESDGTEWVVAVRDDGIGIDPDQLDSVFEVFNRLHTQEDHPGTGVGLSLCRRIVERHGGDIWAESEPGEGSTFYLALPADGPRTEESP